MNIGVPKEIKVEEYRIGLTPEVVKYLTLKGHKVFVEKDAGCGSGFKNADYLKAGAEIVEKKEDVYKNSELIVKVKEPQLEEINLISENQILFTFFHFSANIEMTEKLLEKKAICLAYELVEENRELKILKPMSEIAGKLSIQEGMKYLEKEYGGKGILLSGAEGVKPGKVVIIGGGNVGYNAAKIATGIGADVTILELKEERIKFLKEKFPEINVIPSSESSIKESIKKCDVIIGAVLIPGKRTPVLIKEEDIKNIEEGTVLVDVSIDEGGISDTSRPTTHKNPIFLLNGVIHYCVANIPGIVPRTSTIALNHATFQYVKVLAEKGENALKENIPLKKGMALYKGEIKNKSLKEYFKHIF